MSLSKIPSSLLGKFQCAQCNRYLSMAPIGVRADGEGVCSPCTALLVFQSMTVVRCRLYENLASLHLFPCSYCSHGCSEYVKFNQAYKHENQCPYRTYPCPASLHSICNWMGTVSQIPGHYKAQHPELYLKTPNFRMEFNEEHEVYYLVKSNGILLLLQIRVKNKKCWFNAVYVGKDPNHLQFIKYRVKLSGEDSKRAMELEDKTPLPITRVEMIPGDSVEVDIAGLLVLLHNPEFIQCHWIITTSEDLDHESQFEYKCENGNQLEKIMCSYCKFSMVPPIYRCPLSHVICVECKAYNNSCEICQQTGVEFSRAIDLENVAQSVKFQCRWANCHQIFYCDQIRAHEQQCEKRVYKCPECNQYKGLSEKMGRHFKTAHKEIPFESPSSNTLKFSVKAVFLYVLVRNEIFKVAVTRQPGDTWTVYITYFGPPSLDSYWKYEIRDRYNMLYYASKCSNNHYRAVQRSTYCTHSVRSEYYLTIRFKQQKRSDTWVPLDRPCKRVRK